MVPSQKLEQCPDEALAVGVGVTEVCSSWSRKDIHTTQADPTISLIVQKLTQATGEPQDSGDWKENGELQCYRQM